MSNPTVSLGENFRESQEESDYGVAPKQMHNLQSSQSTDDKNKRKITTPLSGLQQTSHGQIPLIPSAVTTTPQGIVKDNKTFFAKELIKKARASQKQKKKPK